MSQSPIAGQSLLFFSYSFFVEEKDVFLRRREIKDCKKKARMMMICLHRELCAEGYVCAQVCEGGEGAGGSTGFGGKQRQRKYERERERDRVEACLA
jgi:hypothetical protein